MISQILRGAYLGLAIGLSANRMEERLAIARLDQQGYTPPAGQFLVGSIRFWS